MARGKNYLTLHMMYAKLSNDTMNVVKKDNAIELWHRRLSHMSEKGMTCLAKKKVLSGMDQVHLENCVDYLKGKQNRVVFKSFPSSIMKNVLELVHSNLCGPMPKSLGGAQYFVNFIDDHSKRHGHTP